MEKLRFLKKEYFAAGQACEMLVRVRAPPPELLFFSFIFFLAKFVVTVNCGVCVVIMVVIICAAIVDKSGDSNDGVS